MPKNIIYVVFIVTHIAGIVLADEEANEYSQPCKKIGPQCSADGKSIISCTKLNENPSDKTACNPKKLCKEEENYVGCVFADNSSRREFICSDAGEFLDPFNCSRTFVCTEKSNRPAEVCHCPADSTVQPTSDLKCVPGDCLWKDVSCGNREEGTFGHITTKSGQKTSLCYYCPNSTSINVFKDCDVTAQKQHARRARSVDGKNCEPYDFGSESNVAVSLQSATETQSQTSEDVLSTISTQSISSSILSTEDMPTCEKVGDLFQTECDCDYYKCNKDMIPVRKTCPGGMIFNAKHKRCIFGDCDASKCTGRSNS